MGFYAIHFGGMWLLNLSVSNHVSCSCYAPNMTGCLLLWPSMDGLLFFQVGSQMMCYKE